MLTNDYHIPQLLSVAKPQNITVPSIGAYTENIDQCRSKKKMATLLKDLAVQIEKENALPPYDIQARAQALRSFVQECQSAIYDFTPCTTDAQCLYTTCNTEMGQCSGMLLALFFLYLYLTTFLPLPSKFVLNSSLG